MNDMPQFGLHQQAFIVFFAIFWGAVANVQPRWKAFQFSLMFKAKLGNVSRRVILALVLLNFLPILYFGWILYWTHNRGPIPGDTTFMVVAKILLQGVVPALGMFGLYRLWLAVVEMCPQTFYKATPDDVPDDYRHVEPTYRLRWNDNNPKKRPDTCPVVELGRDAGKGNLLAALIYLIVGLVSHWLV